MISIFQNSENPENVRLCEHDYFSSVSKVARGSDSLEGSYLHERIEKTLAVQIKDFETSKSRRLKSNKTTLRFCKSNNCHICYFL